MKKFIHLVLLFALVMSFSVNSVALAQEPTTEPTSEPAAQPTAEPTTPPTAEPTTPPTAEPTTPPTAEPTAPPTAEPTTPPTAEPTAPPTAEPTAPPTAEPTTPPTVEPTVEATIQPTVEPTAEITPTVTVTPTVEITAGEIDAQAEPGSWSTTLVALMNLETSSSTGNIVLHPQSGGSSTNIPVNLLAKGSQHVTLPSSLSNGAYSGVVEMTGQAVAGVINVNSTGAADTYAGFGNSNVGTDVSVPQIFRNYSGGWSSILHIQNASSTNDLVITIRAYIAGSASASVTTSRTLDAGESVSVDVSGSEFANFGVNYGYARVTAADDVALLASNFRNASGLYQVQFVPGAPSGGRQFISPLVFNAYSGGWNSGVQVVNVGGATTNITLKYTTSNGAAYTAVAADVANGASVGFYFPSQPFPKNTFGSAEVTSTSSDIIAFNSSVKYTGGSVGYGGLMLDPVAATSKLAAPIYLNNSTWTTGINVVNVSGSAQDIKATFVPQGVDGTVSGNVIVVSKSAVAANGGVFTILGQVPTGFTGSVFIEGLGGGKIVGNNSLTFYSQGYAANMNAINY